MFCRVERKTLTQSIDVFLLSTGSNRLITNSPQPGNKSQQYHYNKQRKTLDSAADPNKVFDVVGGKKNAGAEVCCYDHHGGDNQKWKIEPL